MKECTVCHKVGAPYKCSKCRDPYCSVSCCKTHKDSCIAIVIEANKPTKEEKSNEIPRIGSKLVTSDSAVLLNSDQLAALDKNGDIQSLIRSTRLTSHIMQVDSASDRQGTLKRMRQNVPEFDEFIGKVLKVVSDAGQKSVQDVNTALKKEATKKEIQRLLKEAEKEAEAVIEAGEESDDDDVESEEDDKSEEADPGEDL